MRKLMERRVQYRSVLRCERYSTRDRNATYNVDFTEAFNCDTVSVPKHVKV